MRVRSKIDLIISANSHKEPKDSDLLALKWPSSPRNILLVYKHHAPAVTQSTLEFAAFVPRLLSWFQLTIFSHIHFTYSPISIILEHQSAMKLHELLPSPVYTNLQAADINPHKIDLVVTFGGDGTILEASSYFALSRLVPPFLSFGMGTLGFLGEWKFSNYKRAFKEVYMSGAELSDGALPSKDLTNSATTSPTAPDTVIGVSRASRVLFRRRARVGVYMPDGRPVHRNGEIMASALDNDGGIHVMNEVAIHRGRVPHLAIIEVFVGGRFLTEAVADGMIIATPTGSTAYSLSSGGSIVHPLVPSLLLTPICARSLSFRPLVLPESTPITLRISEKNRGRELDVTIDGMLMRQGLSVGMELRVWGEDVGQSDDGLHYGGIPCVTKKTLRLGGHGDAAEQWVGGLNGMLKFNYPFGTESNP